MAKPKKSAVSLSDYPMGVSAARPSREDRDRERRYRAQEALDTLSRAEEHRGNRRLMSDVKKLAAEKAAKMARIAKR